jgi:Cd2+/Zn2+-exporting ATPase
MQHIYRVGNMDCAHCAAEVERGVAQLPGVTSVSVDFATTRMVVIGEVAPEALRARVEALGKTLTGASQITPQAQRGATGFARYLLASPPARFALAGAALMLAGVVAGLLLPHLPLNSLLYSAAMLVALLPIARQGLRTLRVQRTFSVNLLMTIAGVGALLIGEYFEGALVIFLFAIGEALEGYTADRARDSLRDLLALRPTEAWRQEEGGLRAVPVEALNIGDTLIVRPGERVPMDGRVLAGSSAVDQAPITGESVPVDKRPDDTVFAGSINGSGTLTIAVTHLAADNTLARIIQLVEQAQSQRASAQRLIDRFAAWYTPAVTVMALLVAVVPALFGAALGETAAGHGTLYRAISLLVIACPCALVISTPVTLISAITAAAQRGVLIKGGIHLENLGALRALIFDKTGTLTQGRPQVVRLTSVASDAQTLRLAAAVEAHSAHPLARAVTAAAQEKGLVVPAASDVSAIDGLGVRGKVEGRMVTVGRLTPGDAEALPALRAAVAESEAAGQTTFGVWEDETLIGVIAVADQPRPASAPVLRQLHAMGLQTVMASGDAPAAAAAIGRLVGVGDVRAGLLPQDKVEVVRSVRQAAGVTGMVGDGVNDAPALAAASVGIAMGGAGSAQAMETADVVLLADDLKQLPYAIRLGRFARRLIVANIALSLGLKLAFLALAIFGEPSLWLAIVADVGMMLVVVINGMRPLRLA